MKRDAGHDAGSKIRLDLENETRKNLRSVFEIP